MNTLTKNRILEKGDEYKSPKGNWLPVPDKDVGLQIMFSPYTEVRRPSEAPTASGDGNVTLVPPPAPTTTPEPPPPAPLTPLTDDGLPTVISPKAHKKVFPAGTPARGIPKKPETIPYRVPYKTLSVKFDKDNPQTIWIGRNGTFNATAIQFECDERIDGNVIQIRPVGKRGLAKNALIEFPSGAIEAIVDWLERHKH